MVSCLSKVRADPRPKLGFGVLSLKERDKQFIVNLVISLVISNLLFSRFVNSSVKY